MITDDSYSPEIVIRKVGRSKKIWLITTIVFCIFLTVSSFYVLSLNSPTTNFPVGVPLEIKEGATASDTVVLLKEHDFVRSAQYLKFLLKTQYQNHFIQAGKYTFDHPLNADEIADAITTGSYADPLVSVTFYEGVRGQQIVDTLAKVLPDATTQFTPEVFDAQIGYLFPDTYFIPSDITSASLVSLMRSTFDQRTAYLKPAIEKSHFTLNEVVTLASIIEREANNVESMKTISGILQNRLNIGMALQVDATLEYLTGKKSDELTDKDLTIDSPYNTYIHTGLPPKPIANPGLAAIEAVLYPTQTDYLYYMTEPDGTFHYAKTFEQHKANKERYLR